jgi:integrase
MWSSAQFEMFVAAAEDSEFRDLFLLAAHTGMRRSELTGLRWANVGLDFDEPKASENVLYVRETLQRISGRGLVVGTPKSDRSNRRITLGETAIEILKKVRVRQLEQQLASGGLYSELNYVFADALGSPYDSDQVSKEFTRIVSETKDLPVLTLHSLRHLQASLLIAAGTHSRIIAERLGHSSTQLVDDLYGHLYPNAQDDTAAAVDAALRSG